jgi:hypothetical protein
MFFFSNRYHETIPRVIIIALGCNFGFRGCSKEAQNKDQAKIQEL